MDINAEEEKLFVEWRKNRPGFVADGVVDKDTYLESSPKILFVLKEVNDPGGGDWDLRRFLLRGGRAQTWSNITRWVEGIRQLQSEVPWKKIESIDEERRRKSLRSIVAVNIKKSPGGHTTDAATLAKTSGEDKSFLNRQFSLYEPDVVICCGTDTSRNFHSIIEIVSRPNWKATRRGIWYHEYVPSRFVVSFAHPEARVADCLLYYGLTDALREILHK